LPESGLEPDGRRRSPRAARSLHTALRLGDRPRELRARASRARRRRARLKAATLSPTPRACPRRGPASSVLSGEGDAGKDASRVDLARLPLQRRARVLFVDAGGEGVERLPAFHLPGRASAHRAVVGRASTHRAVAAALAAELREGSGPAVHAGRMPAPLRPAIGDFP